MEKLITVFTPTYNRKINLIDCYKSLITQTNKNFLWLIVDDGSTDNTEEEVKTLIKENKIEIEYIKKQNGGKASAINLSLEICKTELWVCLDSDDYLTDNAIDIIVSRYSKIKNDKTLCGFLALRTGPDGKVMNYQNEIPKSLVKSTLQNIRYNLGIETEYVFVYKTEIIKEYPYPLIDNEKFIPLSYVFDQIDHKYSYSIIHKSLMVSEYLKDGITKNKLKLIKNNPKSYTLYNKQRITLAPNYKLKFKAILIYGVGCFLDEQSSVKKCIKESPTKILSLILMPFSWIIYKYRF